MAALTLQPAGTMSALRKNNARVAGAGATAMVFAHGYGCDQSMWRFVAPAFEREFRTVLFDHVGMGGSDMAAFNPDAYGSLSQYAADVIALARELDIRDGVFVGHSVSAMVGALAAIEAPELFSRLVMIGPSPRYIDEGDYVGGFTRPQIDELLDFLADNPTAWSQAMAPVIMGNPDRPDLADELADSFCRMPPAVAKAFARATFLADNRDDLPKVPARTLIMQCSEDVIAPRAVGEFVSRQIPHSELVILNASGHCPNLSAPEEVIDAMKSFV